MRIALVVAGAVAMAISASCGTPDGSPMFHPSTPPVKRTVAAATPSPYNSGRLAPSQSTFTMSLDSVRTAYSLVGGFSTLRLAPTAERFVIADIAINEKHGSEQFDANSFQMTTPDGTTYSPLEAIDALAALRLLGKKPLPAKALRTGQQSHGSLIFDLPKGSARLTYRSLLDTNRRSWLVPPGE